MISVIVTVGPNPAYLKYLNSCLNSIWRQNINVPLEVVIVDDAAHLNDDYTCPFLNPLECRYIKNVWNLGQATSINIGIAQAKYDWIFVMGGSDDELMENCLSVCYDQMKASAENKWACYSPMLITSEGETSNLPQGAWMFHRSLWAKLGGYPREAGIGEVDSIFGSIMLRQGVIMYPCGTEPTYWHREHPQALSAIKSSARHEAAGIIRGMCTQEWEQPKWIKGYGYELD